MRFSLTRYRTIFIAGMFFFSCSAIAQPGFYIPKTGKIFFNGDTATIFSNIINQGHFGVGKNAFVNFTGQIWENDPLSLITDESYAGNGVSGTGGWVRFLSDSIRQQLKGGYNTALKAGPAFSHLQIQSRLGVELSESNTKIRKEINLSTGLVYLKDYILVVGDNDPGKISGYNPSKYFVTANKPGNSFLLRENIRSADGQVIFPVGSRDSAYTPAAIRNNSLQGDDYYVNVFDSVRSNVFSGNNLSAQSVNKTWEIGKTNRFGIGEAEIFLQHLNADEGSAFIASRQNAYVSQFTGAGWDLGYPQNSPLPGYLTSGSPLANSGVNSRTFNNTISASSYFTKITGLGDTSRNIALWLNAYRIDRNTVNLYWKAKTRFDVRYYVLERRLSNEVNFKNIDTILSQNYRSISLGEFFYIYNDSNNYTGISYYRLKRLDTANTILYSNIVAVGGKPDSYINLLWPNPTADQFYISLNQTIPFKAIIIFNAAGQIVKRENVNGRTLIQMGGLISGTYFVSLVNAADRIVETMKLVVQRN